MSDFLTTLSNLFTLAFVVSSMFSLGLRLTVRQIIEPLRDVRLVLVALLANFVIVPATALLLSAIFGLNQDLRIGLLLFSVAAGAPLVPKLAQIAKADVRLSVSLIVLLIFATAVIMPFALPLLMPGLRVNAFSLAGPLFLQMLLPLALGLLMDSIYPEASEIILPPLGQIANISLALMFALQIGLNLGNVIGLLGTGAVISILLLLAIALTIGFFLGGRDRSTKKVLSLATGQRNLAAAFVIATGSFADRPNVLALLAAAGLVGMVLMIPVAAQYGKTTEKLTQEQAGLSGPPLSVPATGGEGEHRGIEEGPEGKQRARNG